MKLSSLRKLVRSSTAYSFGRGLIGIALVLTFFDTGATMLGGSAKINYGGPIISESSVITLSILIFTTILRQIARAVFDIADCQLGKVSVKDEV